MILPQFALGEPTGGNKEEIDTLNSQVAEKKKKVEEIQKAIDEYKSKIEKTRLQSVSLSNQMALLDNRITQVQLDIKATGLTLESIKLEIESLKLSIDDKQKVIARQKTLIAELIRNLYRENSKKYIEIMAAYDNFSDFYSRVEYLKKIENDLGNSAKTLRLEEEELQTKKNQADERKKTYESLNLELKEKIANLGEQVDFKQKLLVETQSSELRYKTLVSNLRTQYQQIEGDIAGIEKRVRQKLEEQQKNEQQKFDQNTENLAWPLASRRITAYFHDAGYPFRNIFEHSAIDLAAPQGSTVRAAASGYIARAKRCASASCYSYIMIIHSDGISTVYGHLSGLAVSEDQFVTRGDIIGKSGATPGTVGAGPFTTGPHLHFEVRKNGIPTDPLNYLN